MEDHDQHLAFIVGHYKAGSTWLLNLLSLHPRVRGLRETHLFHHVRHSADSASCVNTLIRDVPFAQGGPNQAFRHTLINAFAPVLRRWKPALGLPRAGRPAGLLDLSAKDRRHLQHTLLAQPLGADFQRVFFEQIWHGLGKPTFLVEKTPQNIAYMDDIREAFPAARLLAVYRDGRDVVVSAQAFRRDYKGAREQSIAEEAAAWRDAMEVHLAAVTNDQLIAVAYETLQTNPREALTSVLEALGLESDPDLVTRMVDQASFEFRTGRKRGEEARGRFDRKGASGDWVNHFDDTDKAVFKEVAGDMLLRLGYEQDSTW